MPDLSATVIMLFESSTALYGLFLAYYAFARGRVDSHVAESDRNLRELLQLVTRKGAPPDEGTDSTRESPELLLYTLSEYVAGRKSFRELDPQESELVQKLSARVKIDGAIPDSWVRDRVETLRSNEAKIQTRYALISAGLALLSVLYLFVIILAVWSSLLLALDLSGWPSVAVFLLAIVPTAFSLVGFLETRKAIGDYRERLDVFDGFASLRWGAKAAPSGSDGPSGYHTPRSAIAFAVVLIALALTLMGSMFYNGGWPGVLMGVAGFVLAFAGLGAVCIVASLFTGKRPHASRPHTPSAVSDEQLPLGMTRRGLALGLLLAGSMLLYVGAGSAAAGVVRAPVLPDVAPFVVIAAVGAALIVASARILWRSPPNR